MARILIGNIKGPKGDKGATGSQGPQGIQGPQGPLPPLVNNGLATVAGVSALDAVYGKTLTDQLNKLDSNLALKANSADYALINLSGANFVYSESSSTVGIQWMFGANKEYGYAINISTVNGTMRFYYLSNGAWLEAWVK